MSKENNLLLAVALEYRKRGWSIIPISIVKKLDMKKEKLEYVKKPLVPWKEYQQKHPGKEKINEWWGKEYPEAGIGLITGKISGLIIVDVDSEKGEEYLRRKSVPLTPCVKTFRGRHIYFQHPGFEVKNFVKKHGLDLRGDKGFVVLPPTKDPRGSSYEWQISPEEAEPARPPKWLLDLIKEEKPARKMKETELTRLLKGVKKGKRHDTATKLAGYWLGKKIEATVALIQLIDWNKKNQPPLPESELERMVTDFAAQKEQPEDWEKGGNKKSEKKVKVWSPVPIANEIKAQFSIKYHYKSRLLWFWDKKEGIWKREGDELLEEPIRSMLPLEKRKNYYIKEVLSEIKATTQIEHLPPEPPSNLIPYKDVIADFKTGETQKFSPDKFFIGKLPRPFIPEKKEIPKIAAFMGGLVAPNNIVSLYELMAYSMLREYPYQMMFWLHGGGANGKGRWIELYRRIIGIDNISAVSLFELQYRTFAKADLHGKLANVAPEISQDILKRTTLLKQFTGEDGIRYEEKFKKSFTAISYTKLIFLANEIPITRDSTYAFYRRLFLIEFPKQYRVNQNADPYIVKAIPDKEIDALAYGCFLILQNMSQRKFPFSFTHHPEPEDTEKEYEELSNPVKTFFEEEVEINADTDDPIPVTEFKRNFREWQEKREMKPWKDDKISMAMTELGHKGSSYRMGIEKKVIKVYRDLEWR